MPSQCAGASTAPDYAAAAAAAAPSPSKSRDPRFSGCVPATVRHIARSFAAATATPSSPSWRRDQQFSKVNKDTDVSFTLDDGTGKIALVRWIMDQPDVRDAAYIQDGVYVKVHVNLTGFQAKKQGFARSIRPVTIFNEVVLHFIECMYVHLENAWPKMQGQLPPAVQTNPYMPYSGGVREYQVHFTQVNQGQHPPAVQTNISTYVPFSDGMREHHFHFTPQVNQGQFPPAVQTNTSTHVPFSGGVREYQVHFTPPVNQLSAYSGTGGQQHDLRKMVLDVMQEPYILEVINFLADMGFLCWTF